jgi:hypothetical protein
MASASLPTFPQRIRWRRITPLPMAHDTLNDVFLSERPMEVALSARHTHRTLTMVDDERCATREGKLYMKQGDSCSMSACKMLFQRIDPSVGRIETFCVQHTCYYLDKRGFLMRTERRFQLPYFLISARLARTNRWDTSWRTPGVDGFGAHLFPR